MLNKLVNSLATCRNIYLAARKKKKHLSCKHKQTSVELVRFSTVEHAYAHIFSGCCTFSCRGRIVCVSTYL